MNPGDAFRAPFGRQSVRGIVSRDEIALRRSSNETCENCLRLFANSENFLLSDSTREGRGSLNPRPTLIEGREAPDFILPDQDENAGSLHGLPGKWIVVYFYPRADVLG